MASKKSIAEERVQMIAETLTKPQYDSGVHVEFTSDDGNILFSVGVRDGGDGEIKLSAEWEGQTLFDEMNIVDAGWLLHTLNDAVMFAHQMQELKDLKSSHG